MQKYILCGRTEGLNIIFATSVNRKALETIIPEVKAKYPRCIRICVRKGTV